MKKIISLLSVLAIFGVYSCVDLDSIEPTDSVSPDRAIVDFSSAQAAVAGVYDDFQDPTSFDNFLSLWQYFSDEAVFTGTFPTRLEFANFNVFPDNTTSQGVFSNFYDAINVANNVIAILPTVDSPTLSEDRVNNLLADAYFIRGLAYFYLAQGYGDVPIVLEPTREVDDKLFVTKSPQADVMAQATSDMQFTAANAADGAPFQASPNAANGMLARLALYAGNWQQAYDLAAGVLGADFDLTTFPYMSDQIFTLNYSTADGNNLAFFYYSASLGGRHSIEPSAKLLSAYEAGDTRFALSIDTTSAEDGVPYGIKYNDVANGADPIMFIRHAELALIAAEAAAQLGNFDDANNWYNMVRARAGLDTKTLDGSNFQDLILQERFVELAMEGGHRLWDLRRTGKALEVLGPLGYDPCDAVWPLPQRDLDRNPNLVQSACCNC